MLYRRAAALTVFIGVTVQAVSAAVLPHSLLRVRQDSTAKPLLDGDFPDPSIVKDVKGDYYAFGASKGALNVQMATRPDGSGDDFTKAWTAKGAYDALQKVGAWANDVDPKVTGPSVFRLSKNTTWPYVMFYSAESKGTPGQRCLGAAISQKIDAAFTPLDEAWLCDTEAGDVGDASLVESDDHLYIVYRVGNKPEGPTRITLREVDPANGWAILGGGAWTTLMREDKELLRSPQVVKASGDVAKWILFYTTGAPDSPAYAQRYATSTAILGEAYKKHDVPLLQSEPYAVGTDTIHFGVNGAGGGEVDRETGVMLFNQVDGEDRKMYGMKLSLTLKDDAISIIEPFTPK